MEIRTCGSCVGYAPCETYLVYDEIDEKTSKICSRRLAAMQDLFGPIHRDNKRRLDSADEYPELDLERCMECAGRNDCGFLLVWDPINQVRYQMCSRVQQKMLPVYGDPNPVELVTDPACTDFDSAFMAHVENRFIGQYCTRCESRVEGERSPGIRAGQVVLCRECFVAVDDMVLERQTGMLIEGVDRRGEEVSLTIPPLEWGLLGVETDLTVPEVLREYFYAAKWNQKIIDTLWQRMQALCLEDDND